MVGLFLGLFHTELVYASFDPEMARVSGVPVGGLDYALLAALSLTVVVGVKVVGIVLLASLLVAPAACALLWSRSVIGATVLSVVIAEVAAVGGLVSSYYLNLPSGATIVILITLVFIGSTVVSRLRG
jgi:ABC-type Mn2+/Zn2+ transport system permease subunit